jgi:hypothetical protein
MKKINVVSEYPTIGLQVFDRYFAYRQSINQKNNYESDVDIVVSDQVSSDCTNVLITYMPEAEVKFDDFDFVFLDNAGESIDTATPMMKQLIDKDVENKIYWLTGSLVDDNFKYAKKLIPYNHNLQRFIAYHTDGFYPQYYDKKNFEKFERKGICFINGQNRSWRNHIITLIQSNLKDIDVYSNISKDVVETLTPEFADMYDKIFCKYLKKNVAIIDEISRKEYSDKSIQIGLNGKFGDCPIGMFLIDHYVKYDCVIFPETSWLNNQLLMTEKIFKCFLAECIPFPIGGANIHYLYNKFGFMTAWNLLPESLQSFDQESNHIKRYELIIDALDWLSKNQDIFTSELAQQIKTNNRINMLCHDLDFYVVKKLDTIFNLDT